MVGEDPHNKVANVLEYEIVVCEFKIQSSYIVYVQTNTIKKGMNPLIILAMG